MKNSEKKLLQIASMQLDETKEPVDNIYLKVEKLLHDYDVDKTIIKTILTSLNKHTSELTSDINKTNELIKAVLEDNA